ncbi:MAG: ABC transporter permease [Gemmatimonadota bacterium]
MLRHVAALSRLELKLFFRQPRAAFFTLVFPLLLVLVFGSVYGGATLPGTTLRAIDYMLPGYIGMIIGTTGLMTIPGWVSTYREQGIFRRLRVTPTSPVVLLISQGVVGLTTLTLGTLLLFVTARVAFGAHVPASVLFSTAAILLGAASMFAFGGMVAAVAGSARTAQAVGMVIYFPMLFLSGALLPRQMMPLGVRRVSDLLPLSYVNELIGGGWLDGAWKTTASLVLVGVLGVTGAIAARKFRWE